MSSLEYDASRVLITDRTIEIILNCVHAAVSEYVNRTLDLNYRNVPKIIVVTRKATVAFNSNMEGNNYQQIELTNWFCARDVYEKRYDLISKYVSDDEQIAYNAFKIIMCDCTMSKWSLVPFLSKLFNYNMRRLARILLHILIINTTSSSRSEKDELERFITLWKNSQNCEDSNRKKYLKHFLRMYIIRLVLDSFNGYPREFGGAQNPAYLNKLMVELGSTESTEELSIPNVGEDLLEYRLKELYADTNKDKRENKEKEYKNNKMAEIKKIETSFTRRILTILHRTEIEGGYNNYNRSLLGIKYFDFEDLLKNLLLDGNATDAATIDPKTISCISDIIYLMNEVTDSTGWVPLTSIKWNNTEEKYTLSAINRVLEDALHNIQNHQVDHSYGIRITYAGQTFLNLLPEFEYFAARFCPLEPKLLSDKSLLKNNKEFICIKNIKKVLYHSVKCVYTIIKRAEAEYSSLGEYAMIDFERMHESKSHYKEKNNSTQITHPIRIFDRQINYLKIFKEYVSYLEPSKSRFKNNDEKNSLINALDDILVEYSQWEDYFKATYSKFLIKE